MHCRTERERERQLWWEKREKSVPLLQKNSVGDENSMIVTSDGWWMSKSRKKLVPWVHEKLFSFDKNNFIAKNDYYDNFNDMTVRLIMSRVSIFNFKLVCAERKLFDINATYSICQNILLYFNDSFPVCLLYNCFKMTLKVRIQAVISKCQSSFSLQLMWENGWNKQWWQPINKFMVV